MKITLLTKSRLFIHKLLFCREHRAIMYAMDYMYSHNKSGWQKIANILTGKSNEV
jgi:hypothetical protein